MELFRETLEKTLHSKRLELLAFKKNPVVEELSTPALVSDATEGKNPSIGHPPLDYSVSKVVQTIRTFEAERLKKSKRVVAEKSS